MNSERSHLLTLASLVVRQLDDLLKRFSLQYSPNYVAKVRDQAGPLVYGADLTLSSDLKEPRLAVMAKPADREFLLRRVRVEQSGDVSVRSRKLKVWVLTLDAEAVVNPLKKTGDCGFRLATTWDATGGRVERNSKFEAMEGLRVGVTWAVNYSLPEVTGKFNNRGTGDEGGERGMHTSLGYAHGNVSRMELAVWPRKLLGALSGDDQDQDNAKKKEELKALLGDGSSTPGSSLIDRFVSSLKDVGMPKSQESRGGEQQQQRR